MKYSEILYIRPENDQKKYTRQIQFAIVFHKLKHGYFTISVIGSTTVAKIWHYVPTGRRVHTQAHGHEFVKP